jgi:2-C-methyl-D-erythritol 4-phosphate cytidylyltransferase
MDNNRKISTIILAAGSGDRLGGRGKAFLKIGEETYLSIVLRLFSNVSHQLIVALDSEELGTISQRVEQPGCLYVEGGTTRQESLKNALSHVTGSVVLVQDVARPLTTPNLIHRVLRASEEHRAVVPVVAIKTRDALFYSENGFLSQPAIRDNLVSLQTPQAYHTADLKNALALATQNSWNEVSVAPLMRRADFPVKIIDGDPNNIKVTYPEDIEFVEKTIKLIRT